MLNLRTPGVYIQEIPSGVRTIASVAPSNTAFIGYFSQGPTDKAIRISSYGDFERTFGGLDSDSVASYAIQQFFLNGGSVAYVVRIVVKDDATDGVKGLSASVDLNDESDSKVFTLSAENPGTWGNRLQYQIEHKPAPNTNNEYTLSVRLVDDLSASRPGIIKSEIHRNLTTSNAATIIGTDSTLIRLQLESGAESRTPAETTGFVNVLAVSAILDDGAGTPVNIFRVDALDNTLDDDQVRIAIADGTNTDTFKMTVTLFADDTTTQLSSETFDNLTTDSAANIINRDSRIVRLTRLYQNNDKRPENVSNTKLQSSGVAGDNGVIPGSTTWESDAAAALEGSASNPQDKTGMHALEDIKPEIFSILAIPDAAELGDGGAQAVYAAANAFCIDQRAFLIIDLPESVKTPSQALNWTPLQTLRSDYAAIYFPHVLVPDPLNGNRARNIPNSGTMAGLYSRTDSQRGVWKAPAGTDLPLRNVSLTTQLTDTENGELNPLGINALRTLPIYGNVSWGSRTLFGENARAHEYKYVPVRRTALFIEESLYQGLQWVVFEPNDPKLWSQIRVNVTAFMQDLFRKGAFAGISPREAYLVKCDSETTTPSDVNLGIVNIVVGFKPLNVAEFVIIKLQQLTQLSE